MATDFHMYAGDTKTVTISVKDADGDAVAITGASIKWQAARSYGKTASISKTTASGITITDGPNGVFDVDLDDTDTEDLEGTFYHEAEITFADATISTVLAGRMRVIPVLIRAT